MKEARELVKQLIDMAEEQQKELYKLYHQLHKDSKTVGDTCLTHHLKILKNLLEEKQTPVISNENVPLSDFGNGCCGGDCGCRQ